MQKQNTPLAVSKNNIKVWYDPVTSHTASHIKDTPDLLQLTQEVVEQTVISEPYMLFHLDLGRHVGTSDLVENSPEDEIVFAKRKTGTPSLPLISPN